MPDEHGTELSNGSSLKGSHEGCWAIVAGLGPSIRELPSVTHCLEIVPNDGREWRPLADFAVTIDTPRFLVRSGRHQIMFEFVGKTLLLGKVKTDWEKWIAAYGDHRAKAWLREAITFDAERWIPRRGELAPWNEKLMYFGGTPFICCSIAAWLGADRVGLIGVDMKDPRKYSDNVKAEANDAYADLAIMLSRTGTELVSLSRKNAITCLPFVDPADFACGPPGR